MAQPTEKSLRIEAAERTTMAKAVANALDLGCELMATCTGEATPGAPQHSYHNIQWGGFQK